MTPDPFDARGFVRELLRHGWRRSEHDPDLIVHPEDHALCLRYDPATGRLTVSPDLDARLARVIPTPRSGGRSRR